jgi:hypothetical protein
MNSSLKRLTEELRSHTQQGRPKDNAAVVGTLMQEVANYVEHIHKQEQLVRQIRDFEKRVNTKPETPEEEQELREAQDALMEAKEAERHIQDQRQYLRRLQTVTEGLLANIRRALN